MSGALKAGSVYVAVSAAIGDFTRQMGQVVKAVEDTAKRVKEAAKGIADVGALFAAGMGAAVLASAQSNRAIQDDLERLKGYFVTMAAELGDAFGPFLRQLTDTVGSVAGAFQRLSPEVKEAVAQVLVFGAAMGSTAVVVGRAAGAVEGLAKTTGLLVPVFSSAGKAVSGLLASLEAMSAAQAAKAATATMAGNATAKALAKELAAAKTAEQAAKAAKAAAAVGLGMPTLAAAMQQQADAAVKFKAALSGGVPTIQQFAESQKGLVPTLAKVAASMGAVLIPVVAVAAAIAGIVLLAGTLYEAWNGGSNALVQAMTRAWDSIKGLGKKLADTLAGWWESLKGFLVAGLRVMLEVAAAQVRSMAKLLAPLAKGLGLDRLSGTFEDLQSLTGDKLLKDLQSGAAFLADKVKEGAATLRDGAKRVGSEVAEGVRYGLNYSTKGLKRAFNDVGAPGWIQDLKTTLGGVVGGPAANIRKPTKKSEESEKKKLMKELAKGADQLNRDYAAEAHDEFIAAVRAEEASGAAMFRELEADAARMAEEAQKLALAAAERIRAAKDALTQKFTSAFGDLSALFDTFQTGMAAGGPAGGLVAVLGDLLTRSQQFATLVETISGLIGMVADWLGKLAEPLIPLVGAITTVVEGGLKALAPVLTSLTAFIEPLVPSIMVLGELLQGLAPVIAMVVAAMTLVLNPLQLFAGPAMKALFDVLKFVSSIILRVVKGLADVWNGIIGAVQSVFRKLADISVLGVKPLGFLDGWADGLDSAKVSTDAMAKALQALTGMTYEAALEKAKETAEVVRNRQATEKATQALTNVPSAFKYALHAFEAQDAQGPDSPVPVPTTHPPAPSSGGAPWDSGSASQWGGTGTTTPGQTPGGMPGSTLQQGNVYVNVTATNPAEATEAVVRMGERIRMGFFGSRGTRAAVEGT